MSGTSVSQSVSLSSLVWAELQPTISGCEAQYPWMGVGLLSDKGLPFDAMAMLLTARALREHLATGRPALCLLPDSHAMSIGEDAQAVFRRVHKTIADIEAVADVLDMPVEFVLASELDDVADYLHWLCEVARVICSVATDISSYMHRGIADTAFLSQHGGVKVGWTAVPDIRTNAGRFHEPTTDMLAQQVDPTVAAVYTCPGRRMDLKRPKSPPYLEMTSTDCRFMITGPDAGSFRRKAEACADQKGAHTRAVELLGAIVKTFEEDVAALPDLDVFGKADEIVRRVNRRH